jgi:uncharacterized protein (DUF1697 family)
MKFIALLRGINVGGNNKVSMSELKATFESLAFANVQTYINSGNVIFDSDIHDKVTLVNLCEKAIESKFGFRVVCSIIKATELHDALAKVPSWWGTGDGSKHNALFIIAPTTAQDVIKEVGDAEPEYEKVAAIEPIIFWSAPLETFSRTRYSKIVGTKSYASVTIRNANTTKKLADLTK